MRYRNGMILGRLIHRSVQIGSAQIEEFWLESALTRLTAPK